MKKSEITHRGLYNVGFIGMRMAVALALAAVPGAAGQEAPTKTPFGIRWDGRDVFVLGVNYPWYNGYRGLDIGHLEGNRTIQTLADWKHVDLQQPPEHIAPGASGFDLNGIGVQLEDMHDMGISVVRWFWGNDGRGFFVLDQNDNCTGIQPEVFLRLDQILALCAQHHVLLMPSLFDFRFVSGDIHLLYADGSKGRAHALALKDPAKRQLLIERYIKPLVRRYRDNRQIFAWEIMNEAGNVTRGTDPVTGYIKAGENLREDQSISLQEVRIFLNETYDAIKSEDPRHMVLPSGLARPEQLPIVVGSVNADFYGAHYDDNGVTDYGRVLSVKEIQERILDPLGLRLDKPLLMTESAARLQANLAYYVQSAYDGGWAGILPWSYYFMIGFDDRLRYDGPVTSEDGLSQDTIRYFQQFKIEHWNETELDR